MINLFFSLVFATMALSVIAEETAPERAARKTHDAERAGKRAVHKAEEAVCAKGDMKCAEQKAKHRAQEGKDYINDKVDENR